MFLRISVVHSAEARTRAGCDGDKTPAGLDSDDRILPVEMEDNYLTLMPSELRRLRLTFRLSGARGAAVPPGLDLLVSGFNVEPVRMPIPWVGLKSR